MAIPKHEPQPVADASDATTRTAADIAVLAIPQTKRLALLDALDADTGTDDYRNVLDDAEYR